ncbi:MAG: carboxypeptidase regulatory-like domain-containing protein [Methylococcaceae bacterium]|nr:carboxypeptidase regulatory-like domain-containing protein [Methylococcaceae bacterium]
MKFHFILPWAMLSFLVFVIQPLIKSQTQGKINSGGGIGADEQRGAIQVKRADYNLSLLFLIGDSEEYLDDLKGGIKDAGGNTFLDAVPDNHMLFPEFKTGRDITSANRDGQWIDKTVNVDGKTVYSPSIPRPRQSEHVALDLPGS